MAFQWDNNDNQWKYTNVDGITLQDIINQVSVDGTGNVSDLNLPTTAHFNADEYFKTSTSVESGGGDGSPLFTLAELNGAGFTVPEVKNHFEISEIQSAGYSTHEIGNGGYSTQELVDANFTANQIIHETNFTVEDLEEDGFSLKTPTYNTRSIGKYSTVTLSNNISKMISMNNEIFILDNENDKISKITENTNDETITFNEDFITGLNKPKDIIKVQDNYYISNSGDNTVVLANNTGVLNSFPIIGTENESGDIDETNKLVMTDDNVEQGLSFQQSKIDNPQEIFIDNAGNISFYDKDNSKIKQISLSDGNVNYAENEIYYLTISDSHIISRYIDGVLLPWIGKENESGDIDGNISAARLNSPVSLKTIIENDIENIYFLDKGNGKLKYFSNTYPVNVQTIVSGLSSPEGFIKYGDDYYICDTGNNKIVKFEDSGKSDFVVLTSPIDISLMNNSTDGDHFFVTCANHTIFKVFLDRTKHIISGEEGVNGLANGLDRRVSVSVVNTTSSNSKYDSPTKIISDNSLNILIIDQNNNAIRKHGLNSFDSTTEVGSHYITQDNGTIKQYLNTSETLIDFISDLGVLNKIEVKDDYLYIIQKTTNSLKRINKFTNELELIEDGLNNPNSFLLDGNDFYITDTDNDRIVKLARDPLVEVPGPVIFDSSLTQIGTDISGNEAGEKFGYAISYNNDGTVVAASAIKNSESGSNTGVVRVYDLSGNEWIQKGFDIAGEATDDESGQDIKLNKVGNVIAISSILNDPDGQSKAGHVRVYEFKEYTQYDEDNDIYYYSSRLRDTEDDATQTKPIIITENVTTEPVVGNYYWIQKGEDINGEIKFDRSGFNIAMNIDGSRIAVGEPYFDPIDDLGSKKNQGGRVRVYEYSNNDWVQKGGDINGVDTNDYFGYSIDLNEIGDYIGVGAYRGLSNDGYVKIFKYNFDTDEWELFGSMISGESASGQRFGTSISLDSDVNHIIIGAPLNDSNNGVAKVYKYDIETNDWSQLGGDIVGTSSGKLGHKVSINWNGKVIAVSGNEHSLENENDNGIVKLFKYVKNINEWQQIFTNLTGNNEDEFGTSIQITKEGNKIAIGSIGFNNDSGNVKVYKFGEIDGITYKSPTYAKTILATVEKPLDIIKDDNGDFYVTQQNHTVSKIYSTDDSVRIVAGVKDEANNVDGENISSLVNHFNDTTVFVDSVINSRFNTPGLMFKDGDTIFISDVSNNSIKTINAVTNLYEKTGCLYVSEEGYHTIKKIDLSGAIIDYAGIEDVNGTTDGVQGVNKFDSPKGLALDSSRNLLIVDSKNNQIRKIDKITGITTTIASGFNNPTDIINIGYTEETITVSLAETIFNPAVQVGNTFIGPGDTIEEANGDVRLDMNNDGTIAVLGFNNHYDADGMVKVIKYNSDNYNWEQLGQDIGPNEMGMGGSSNVGNAITINGSGNIIAIAGAPGSDVCIFQYSTPGVIGGTWLKLDSKVTAYSGSDGNGFSISLNDNGDTLIVGAPGNDTNGDNIGLVRIYKVPIVSSQQLQTIITNSGTSIPVGDAALQQLGGNIYGETASDFIGHSVRLNNNGSIIAIGGPQSGVGAGVVRIYRYSTPGIIGGTWAKLGEDIIGEAVDDGSGANDSISLNGEGTIIAIGAYSNTSEPDVEESMNGHVRVYEWNETAWVQKGFDINGEYLEDQSGWSVSLNNTGIILGSSSILNKGTNKPESGQVRVYKWREYTQNDQDNLTYHYTSYTQDTTQTKLLIITENLTTAPVIGNYYWTQMVFDIDGLNENDRSGFRIKIDKNGEKIGITSNNIGNDARGSFEVYKIREGGFDAEEHLKYDKLLVSDTDNNIIKQILTTETVEITNYIGSGVEGTFDGVGVLAELSKPKGLFLDSSGNIFIADSATHCIRKADSNLKVTTEAGLPGVSGQENGQDSNSKFNEPNNMTMIDGKLYISDTKNHSIREGVIEYNEGGNFAEIPIQTIRASDEESNLFFGSAISFDENYMLISAKHQLKKGKVYLYKLVGDQWEEITTLQPDDLVENDEFGKSLLITDNYAFIGCENKDSKKGIVYIYQKELLDDTIWNLLQIVQSSDVAADNLFGKSIEVFGNNLLIGAPMDETKNLPGKVYQFLLNDPNGITGYWGVNNNGSWNETSIIMPEDSEKNVNDQFGCSISMANNLVVIGANKKDRNATDIDTGYVYMFVKNSLNEWLESSPGPVSNEASLNDEFGISVLLNKELTIDELNQQQIIVGAWKKDDPLDSGRVYIYNLAEASSGSITIGYNPRSGEWGTLVLPKTLKLSDNMNSQPGDSLIYDGVEWSNTEYDWKIVYENQTINITETELNETGIWTNNTIADITI
jgi:hypothetical protein